MSTARVPGRRNAWWMGECPDHGKTSVNSIVNGCEACANERLGVTEAVTNGDKFSLEQKRVLYRKGHYAFKPAQYAILEDEDLWIAWIDANGRWKPEGPLPHCPSCGFGETLRARPSVSIARQELKDEGFAVCAKESWSSIAL
jgi:hypothetical protein